LNTKFKMINLKNPIFWTYIFLGILVLSITLSLDASFREKYPERMESPFTAVWPDFSKEKSLFLKWNNTMSVENEKLFNTIIDVKNYPNIIPGKVISVEIINQTSNTITAREKLIQSGIILDLLVRHTFMYPNEHFIEVLDGDAMGTMINQTFTSLNGNTTINTQIELHVKGPLSPITFFLKSGIQNFVDTILEEFVNYSQGFDTKTMESVDQLYREILHRPADKTGLEYFSSNIDQGKMTLDDVKNELLNSNEKNLLLEPAEWKTMDELTPRTKESINDLYLSILNRPADLEGLQYYGSLIEADKLSVDKLKEILIQSEERKNLGLN